MECLYPSDAHQVDCRITTKIREFSDKYFLLIFLPRSHQKYVLPFFSQILSRYSTAQLIWRVIEDGTNQSETLSICAPPNHHHPAHRILPGLPISPFSPLSLVPRAKIRVPLVLKVNAYASAEIPDIELQAVCAVPAKRTIWPLTLVLDFEMVPNLGSLWNQSLAVPRPGRFQHSETLLTAICPHQ